MNIEAKVVGETSFNYVVREKQLIVELKTDTGTIKVIIPEDLRGMSEAPYGLNLVHDGHYI